MLGKIMSNKTNTSALPFAKVASIVLFISGLIATYSHFAGYTYLKGYIQGLGLGSIEFTLTPLESTYQTSLFLQYIFNDFAATVKEFVSMGLFAFILFCIFGGGYLWFLRYLFKPSGAKATSSNTYSNKQILLLKILGYPFGFGVGTTVLLLMLLLMMGASSQIFLLAYESGKGSATQRLSSKVCVSLSEFREKNGINSETDESRGEHAEERRASCTMVKDNNGKIYSGVVIHQTKDMKLFVTNEMSILFNDKFEVVACSLIVNIAEVPKIDDIQDEKNVCKEAIQLPKTLDKED
jgi:hypothetical protein